MNYYTKIQKFGLKPKGSDWIGLKLGLGFGEEDQKIGDIAR